MEQQRMQYLMWLKTKQRIMFKSNFQTSISSWEEQAFAEDAAGPLGGFIWPPRSYTCTFCRREFRSAQALGGHMNVHRRDRARLRQSSSSSPSSLSPQPDSGSPYSSVSAGAVLSPQNSSAYTLNPGNPSSPNGSDTSNSGKFLSISNQKLKREMYNHEDSVDTNLSVGVGYDAEERNTNVSNSKKRRFMGKDLAAFSSCSRNGNAFAETVGLRSKPGNSIDESLDLELRL